VIRTLRNAGIGMSDRRIVKLQKLVAAAAVLDGRSVATGADLWPLVFTIVRPNDQDRARDLLRTTLEASRNAAVGAAAEHASLGPLARAARLEQAAASLIGSVPADAIERRRWRLKLEAIARELDAAFPTTGPTSMPESLAATRGRIVAQLAEVPLEAAVPGAADAN
jgi:MoxR-like ATPase